MFPTPKSEWAILILDLLRRAELELSVDLINAHVSIPHAHHTAVVI